MSHPHHSLLNKSFDKKDDEQDGGNDHCNLIRCIKV
jgi:hypothetical protein